MAAGRAKLQHVAQDDDGDVQRLKSVLVYEKGTTTPYIGAIYAAPSGGAPISSFATDGEGLIELYVDKNSARRADVLVAGALVPLKSEFTLDVEDLVFQGMTAAASIAGGLTVTKNAATPVLSLRNTDAAANILEVKNAAGTIVGVWDKLGLQLYQPSGERMSRLSIGQGFLDNAHDDLFSLQIVQNVTGTGFGGTAAQILCDYTVTGRDDSAVSIQARQLTTGNTALRPMDLNVMRQVGAGNSMTMGLEVGFHSTIAPASDDNYHIGIWLLQNVAGFLNGAGPFVAQAVGFKISGNSGWNDFVRFYDKAGLSVFRVAGGERAGDRHGDLAAGGDIYSEPVAGLGGSGNGGTRVGILDHSLATGTTTRFGMHYSDGQNAGIIGARTLGTGYRPILLVPNGGNVGVGLATSAAVTSLLTVGGALAASGISSLAGVALSGAHSVGGAAVITPTQIAANTDNYNPPGLATARVIVLTTDAARNLTGITAPSVGQILTLVNVGSFNLVIKNSVTSTATNQFSMAADITLTPGQSASFFYHVTSSRWRTMDR